MNSTNREITFFYSNSVERETAEPVAAAAQRRGFSVRFSEDPFVSADIGIYCQHNCFPEHAQVSIAMLHDLGQGQLAWPNLWRDEPWDGFDAAVLPGTVWAERWLASCHHPFSRPRKGVYVLGWPKSDIVFSGTEGRLSDPAATLRDKLNLQHDTSILYAPAWEIDGKQDTFVQALKDLPVNLLLKQFPWTDQWPEQQVNVAEMNALHRNIAPNVHIVDAQVSIMHAIELADILVSDESSCLVEALLKSLPVVAVSDWMIPDTIPPRPPAAPFDFLIRTQSDGLRETITELISSLPQHTKQATQHRARNFTNLGNASERVMDLVEALINEAEPPFAPLAPTAAPVRAPLWDRLRRRFRNLIYKLKYRLGIRQALKKSLLSALRAS